MLLALFFAQHVSNATTFILRNLRLCVGILLWFDVCWRYGVVRLGWCGILMQAEAQLQKIKQVTSVGLSLFNYQEDAQSNKHKLHYRLLYNLFLSTNVKFNDYMLFGTL